MNRLKQAFAELDRKHQKAFVPYIMAGDGGIETLKDKLKILEEMGATAIEIGVPFSDPVADGPTIQQAGIRALQNGTSLTKIIEELSIIRNSLSVPILLMTYLNPIYSYGIQRFVENIQIAGVDGCIIPDLPLEEEEIIVPMLNKANIQLIRLVTLTTPLERIKFISQKGEGFLYAVTIKGTTGVRNNFEQELSGFLKSVKEMSPIPVLAGFGISDEKQIKEISLHCDGVIVGSKIIECFQNGDIESLEKLVSTLKF
ncbi:MAG: tryptophan synthase subunit alpha [Bacillota bacterium]|nr:tryptophan synthase subunit alpha [Bacillota bacterium]